MAADDLLAVIRQGPGPAPAQAQKFIGVPDDFMAETPVVPTGTGPGLERATANVTPRYKAGDDVRLFANLPVEQRAQLQDALSLAGFIGPKTKVRDGVWDNATKAAMASVLAIANRTGSSWEETLSAAAANPPAPSKEPDFVPDTFRPLDPAALREDVTQYVKSKLGHDPTPEDLAYLTGVLSDADRAAYEANVQVAEGAAADTPPDVVAKVDPKGRFEAAFRSYYDGQLGTLEAAKATQQRKQPFTHALNSMHAAVAAGGA